MIEATVAGGGLKRTINTAGCFGVASLMHELGHAVGMAHEQSRPDAFHEVTEVGGESHGPILETLAGGVPAISNQCHSVPTETKPGTKRAIQWIPPRIHSTPPRNMRHTT